jgi:archaellum component FlaC
MNFEERIEALRERHEALTMNLGLISHEVEVLRESVAKQHDNIEELIPIVRDLVRVAAMHERRITRLEGQEPDPAL